jgi:hypothetical protein
MLIKAELIEKLKLVLKLTQPGDGDEVCAYHLETGAINLSQEFATLTVREETVTIDSSNQVTFPSDMMSIIGVWVGTQELQPVGHADFYAMSQAGSLNNVIRIQEKAGNWIGTVYSNTSASTSTVNVIYKSYEVDPSAFPEYYKRLLVLWGAADYYLFEDLDNLDKESKIRARYREELQAFRELQSHGMGLPSRRKSQYELDWNRALRHFTVANDQDLG